MNERPPLPRAKPFLRAVPQRSTHQAVLPPASPDRAPVPSPLDGTVADIVGTAIETFVRCWHALLAQDTADGAHKFRVAARRLRIVLHTLRRDDPDGSLSEVRKALAVAARLAGKLRDLDVLVGEIVAPLIGADAPTGIVRLRDLLEADRRRTREEMCESLQSAEMVEVRQRIERLPSMIASGPASVGAKAIGKLARRELRKRWRDFSRKAGDLGSLDSDALHDARKSLKAVRYTLAQFSPCLEMAHARAFSRRLAALQDVFGYLNDVKTAASLTARVTTSTERAEIDRAIGYVLGVHAERAARARRKLDAQHAKLMRTPMAKTLDRA